jgi:hypothetical protein
VFFRVVEETFCILFSLVVIAMKPNKFERSREQAVEMNRSIETHGEVIICGPYSGEAA